MPDIFYAPILNSILYMLVGRRFDSNELREIARAIMRFLRSGDATGGAVTLAPWLRHIAPDFFGYTAAIEENKRLMTFMQVKFNAIDVVTCNYFQRSFFYVETNR